MALQRRTRRSGDDPSPYSRTSGLALGRIRCGRPDNKPLQSDETSASSVSSSAAQGFMSLCERQGVGGLCRLAPTGVPLSKPFNIGFAADRRSVMQLASDRLGSPPASSNPRTRASSLPAAGSRNLRRSFRSVSLLNSVGLSFASPAFEPSRRAFGSKGVAINRFPSKLAGDGERRPSLRNDLREVGGEPRSAEAGGLHNQRLQRTSLGRASSYAVRPGADPCTLVETL